MMPARHGGRSGNKSGRKRKRNETWTKQPAKMLDVSVGMRRRLTCCLVACSALNWLKRKGAVCDFTKQSNMPRVVCHFCSCLCAELPCRCTVLVARSIPPYAHHTSLTARDAHTRIHTHARACAFVICSGATQPHSQTQQRGQNQSQVGPAHLHRS